MFSEQSETVKDIQETADDNKEIEKDTGTRIVFVRKRYYFTKK